MSIFCEYKCLFNSFIINDIMKIENLKRGDAVKHETYFCDSSKKKMIPT